MNKKKQLINTNHSSGRDNSIKGVCIHTTDGSYAGTLSWFNNPSARVSAHYVISESGNEVAQCVREDDTAWAQGVKYGVTAKLVREMGSANPNSYLISIECADGGNPDSHDRTGQYVTLIELVREICQRWNIPMDRKHIIGHREIRSSKTCPGNINVDYLVNQLGAGMTDLEKTLMENFGVKNLDELKVVWDKETGFLEDEREKTKRLKVEKEKLKSTLESQQQMHASQVDGYLDDVADLDNLVCRQNEDIKTLMQALESEGYEISRDEGGVLMLRKDYSELETESAMELFIRLLKKLLGGKNGENTTND